MSLTVTDVSFLNYRNCLDRELSLSPAITILAGRNAAGKTNTIEALQLLTSGTSFRNPTPSQLLKEGCERGRIGATITGEGRVLEVAIDLTSSRKGFTRNGKSCRAADLLGTLPSVLFNPDDLLAVKGPGSVRRGEIDSFGRQANKGYNRVWSSFTRSLEQRNHLLKDEIVDTATLDAWDASLATIGSKLLFHRLSLFKRLKPHIESIYADVADGEKLECLYRSTVGDEVDQMEKEDLAVHYANLLASKRTDDLRRGQTLIGPHRDDIEFLIDGRDARAFGSQGQQRSIVLAWKLAEVELSRTLLDTCPLLLLDDVMSELDARRRSAVTSFVAGQIQTVITTTNLGYFTDETFQDAKVVRFGDE